MADAPLSIPCERVSVGKNNARHALALIGRSSVTCGAAVTVRGVVPSSVISRLVINQEALPQRASCLKTDFSPWSIYNSLKRDTLCADETPAYIIPKLSRERAEWSSCNARGDRRTREQIE